tara:strand:- start:3961 stop:4560 length:600 start_codon:yes stop_codon:yes gene_type:complete
MDDHHVIKIQNAYRRHSIRVLKDGFTKNILISMIEKYNFLYKEIDELNQNLKNKKIRQANYPSEITENIVKFAIKKKYGVVPCWDTNKGDLILGNKHLEVKGSIDLHAGGPSSFGPKEEWHRIYFVDCKKHQDLWFKVYEIKLSNTSNVWKKIKVNKKDTYEDQCKQSRRPRITFRELIHQIPIEYVNVIFDNHIDLLD